MAGIERLAAEAPSPASSEPNLERDLETALSDALFDEEDENSCDSVPKQSHHEGGASAVITLGQILERHRPSTRRAMGMGKALKQVKNWSQEALATTSYSFHCGPEQTYITLCYVTIPIPKERRGKLTIKVHIVEGRHPNLFAMLAGDVDPARRLAFEVTSETTVGNVHTWFAQSDKLHHLERANTCVEVMTLGLGREHFLRTDRRFIPSPKGRRSSTTTSDSFCHGSRQAEATK